MIKMHVGGLPPDTSEKELSELFAAHGQVRSVDMKADVFSGQCRGFGFIEMEGHEARAAIDALNGQDLRGHPLRVRRASDARGGRGSRRSRRR